MELITMFVQVSALNYSFFFWYAQQPTLYKFDHLQELGGKLTMAISTSSSSGETDTSQSDSLSASYSFKAAASGFGVSASAAGDYASAKSTQNTNQTDFQSRSSKSSIITYGGAPGSFGPETDDGGSSSAPSSWGEWAQTVDLRPVPIEFTLDRIYNLFPDTPEYSQLRAQWLAAELAFYSNTAGNQPYHLPHFLFIFSTCSPTSYCL